MPSRRYTTASGEYFNGNQKAVGLTPMRYIKVDWLHSHPDYPVELYSEIDEEGWELRKVEVFRDGRAGFADQRMERGTTRLGIEPLPTIEEIALDLQFRPVEISRPVFEQVWATHGPGRQG